MWNGCRKWLRPFFLVFTLIWGPPKIILPMAPQSVRPGLDTGLGTHSIGFYFLLMALNFCGIFIHCVGDDNIGSVSFGLVYLCM